MRIVIVNDLAQYLDKKLEFVGGLGKLLENFLKFDKPHEI